MDIKSRVAKIRHVEEINADWVDLTLPNDPELRDAMASKKAQLTTVEKDTLCKAVFTGGDESWQGMTDRNRKLARRRKNGTMRAE